MALTTLYIFHPSPQWTALSTQATMKQVVKHSVLFNENYIEREISLSHAYKYIYMYMKM